MKEIKGKSFLVTGGAGFIGSHIVEYLLHNEAGLVRVLDNRMTNLRPFLEHPAFEYIQGDIVCEWVCMSACDGIDYVCHQAALISVPISFQNVEVYHEVNVKGFFNILSAAHHYKIKAVVYASSSAVYGNNPISSKVENLRLDPLSPYACTKAMNELQAKMFSQAYGMNIIGLRYFNVFGPRQSVNGGYAAVIPTFINNLLEGKDCYINGDGSQTRDFVSVHDVVQANILAMLNENPLPFGSIFNVGVQDSLSINELYTQMCDHMDIDKPPVYREKLKGDVLHSSSNISAICNMLGYSPSPKRGQQLEETIEYFKSIK